MKKAPSVEEEGKKDDSLVERIARGDQSAFLEIFEKYGDRVLGYAMRLTGGNKPLSEDISQASWLKMIGATSSYRPKERFSSWLMTIVRNTAFNEFRLQKKIDDSDTLSSINLDSFFKSSFEDEVLEQSQIEDLKEAIDQLPESQRQILTTWMTEELSYNELAHTFGSPVSSIKSILYRARENLKRRLGLK